MCLAIKNYFKEKNARKEILNFDDERIDSLVKIQGTDFDRKRKYDSFTVSMWREDYRNGVSFKDISIKYGVPVTTVKYNLDDNFKKYHNEHRDGRHMGVDVCDFVNRVEYKKSLIRNKRIKVSSLV